MFESYSVGHLNPGRCYVVPLCTVVGHIIYRISAKVSFKFPPSRDSKSWFHPSAVAKAILNDCLVSCPLAHGKVPELLYQHNLESLNSENLRQVACPGLLPVFSQSLIAYWREVHTVACWWGKKSCRAPLERGNTLVLLSCRDQMQHEVQLPLMDSQD